ncbi:Hypothetical predicted protein [Octopus vulgaris]|uniref:Uncharacterized protein n=1 Tax=Octopus vulgaris TaxID=6645 RepID=A0AA36BF13_OCTVU|nr:Hypothetical predicted protein [Octopus vulgaris]
MGSMEKSCDRTPPSRQELDNYETCSVPPMSGHAIVRMEIKRIFLGERLRDLDKSLYRLAQRTTRDRARKIWGGGAKHTVIERTRELTESRA